VLLVEYDIVYMTRKVVKGSVIIDHLEDNTIEDYEPLNFYFLYKDLLVVEKEEELDWWTMYFDRAINIDVNKVQAVMISPNRKQYSILIKL